MHYRVRTTACRRHPRQISRLLISNDIVRRDQIFPQRKRNFYPNDSVKALIPSDNFTVNVFRNSKHFEFKISIFISPYSYFVPLTTADAMECALVAISRVIFMKLFFKSHKTASTIGIESRPQ